jgi:tetratricopeptide (TPR) repeat protein
MNTKRLPLLASLALALVPLAPALAQFPGVTLPPSGDNQRSSVTQQIGLVSVTVEYSSPDVHAPDGTDRAGKIWGELVPWGMADLGFGTCGKECPWRGGANENTVFTVSHDVKVQGQTLPAGRYGLHFVPDPNEWTVIFSKNSTSWGSYYYDAREDALRVKAKPEADSHHEWLTYEFVDRQKAQAKLALKWEKLRVPFTITVDNAVDLYVQNLRRELRSSAGFQSQGWVAAAQYCLQNQTNLEEALRWAERGADSSQFGGEESFTTLALVADLQAANGKAEAAKQTRAKAIAHPTAGVVEVHQYARRLQATGKPQEALELFEANARRFPGQWPVEFGLARGYQAVGKKKEALEHAKKALAQAPDDANRRAVEGVIQQLEKP